MRDDTILDRLAGAPTAREAAGLFLYHGTAEPFRSAPRPGFHDGVFWTAATPAVAQAYIPVASQMLLSASRRQMADRIEPSLRSGWYDVVRRMGVEAEGVEWGPDGMPASWRTQPGYPTYRDACDFLERELGYAGREGDGPFSAWVNVGVLGRHNVLLPADHRGEGRLFVVDAVGLDLYDHVAGREGSLMEPDYHKHRLFRQAEAAGYDGIAIHDFCQPPRHGNVGHVSYGLFASAIARVAHAVIPARSFDWGADLSQAVTPEFEAAWRAARHATPAPR